MFSSFTLPSAIPLIVGMAHESTSTTPMAEKEELQYDMQPLLQHNAAAHYPQEQYAFDGSSYAPSGSNSAYSTPEPGHHVVDRYGRGYNGSYINHYDGGVGVQTVRSSSSTLRRVFPWLMFVGWLWHANVLPQSHRWVLCFACCTTDCESSARIFSRTKRKTLNADMVSLTPAIRSAPLRPQQHPIRAAMERGRESLAH